MGLIALIRTLSAALFCLLTPLIAWSDTAPLLRFTDLISGPAVGLDDGKGSGTIVTLWGQHMPDDPGNSVHLIDSNGQTHAPIVYYWKPADGNLPGGPADLFTPMQMYEVAFAVPELSAGDYNIQVVTPAGISNLLPFRVREGRIFHVRTNGSDTANGSYSEPWQSMRVAVTKLRPGDIVYVHDHSHEVQRGLGSRALYKSGHPAEEQNQYAIVAYPNSQPIAEGEEQGVATYMTSGMVVSKLTVKTGNNVDPLDPDPEAPWGEGSLGGRAAFGIQATNFGRIVANRITDMDGRCPNSWHGAITTGSGGAESEINSRVSRLKIYGNYIHNFGCAQSDKYIHTTYISVRNNGIFNTEPFEFAYNYLRDNEAKFGIHVYDENLTNGGGPCATYTGAVRIHNNYVLNQRGSGINIGAKCTNALTNDWEIYNNVVINSGLGPHYSGNNYNTTHGISIRDYGLAGSFHIVNNTFLTWGMTDETVGREGGIQSAIGLAGHSKGAVIDVTRNIFSTAADKSYLGTPNDSIVMLEQITGSNNIWWSDTEVKNLAVIPNFDRSPLTNDPKIDVNTEGKLQHNGPLTRPNVTSSIDALLTHDIFGYPRGTTIAVGAAERPYRGVPLPPIIFAK